MLFFKKQPKWNEVLSVGDTYKRVVLSLLFEWNSTWKIYECKYTWKVQYFSRVSVVDDYESHFIEKFDNGVRAIEVYRVLRTRHVTKD